MISQLKPALKYFAILALVLAMGMSVWLIPGKVKKEKDLPITPPIDAKDEAGRYIQKASQNFFYHEFDEAIENYKKVLENRFPIKERINLSLFTISRL